MTFTRETAAAAATTALSGLKAAEQAIEKLCFQLVHDATDAAERGHTDDALGCVRAAMRLRDTLDIPHVSRDALLQASAHLRAKLPLDAHAALLGALRAPEPGFCPVCLERPIDDVDATPASIASGRCSQCFGVQL